MHLHNFHLKVKIRSNCSPVFTVSFIEFCGLDLQHKWKKRLTDAINKIDGLIHQAQCLSLLTCLITGQWLILVSLLTDYTYSSGSACSLVPLVNWNGACADLWLYFYLYRRYPVCLLTPSEFGCWQLQPVEVSIWMPSHWT